MKKIKLMLLVLTAIICSSDMIVFASSEITNNEINNDYEVIYTSEKRNSGSDSFYGYVVKNGELYINFWFNTGGEGTAVVFKYTDGKLVDMKLSKRKVDENFAEVKPTYNIETESGRVVIDNDRYIELGTVDDPSMTLVEGNKRKYTKNDFVIQILTYMYLDKDNEKLYFAGSGYKEDGKKFKVISGILIYDIKSGNTDAFIEEPEREKIDAIKNYEKFKTKDYEDFFNPIRVPNTPYLLFYIEKRVDNKYFYEIAIKEVPEWKAEIDRQEKNKKENPKAKTAYTNGSANVRDNPKGKVISTLNDWTEVLILEQKNDWYHILYADIEGWTYKDNIRQAE
jgi:hypothetical protein